MSTAAAAFRFDGENLTARRVAERRAARLVTVVSNQTRRAIRQLIVRSIEDGIPPLDAARMLRAIVGVNAQQAHAITNFRASQINLGLTGEPLEKTVARYTARKIRERAETIARTEIMEALNDGAQVAYLQAQREGLLGREAKKEWITTPAESTCDACAPMDGVQVPLSGTFHTPDGEVSGPPLHPRCRCTVAVVP